MYLLNSFFLINIKLQYNRYWHGRSPYFRLYFFNQHRKPSVYEITQKIMVRTDLNVRLSDIHQI